MRERVERLLADMDMVPREEFEAVKAMAQKARGEQVDLAARLAELEAKLSAARPVTARSRVARKPRGAATPARAPKAEESS